MAGKQDLIIVKQDAARRYAGAQPLWRQQLVWVAAGLEPDFSRARAWRNLPLVLSPAPCVSRSRAAGALDTAGAAWTGVFTSPSFAGQARLVPAAAALAEFVAKRVTRR